MYVVENGVNLLYSVIMDIGKKIKRIRESRGISQEELASLVDMHRNHIGRIERGESNPKFTTVYDIAKALNINEKEIVDWFDI
jgi:transcriptional regulator with XRE-family HTH domain